MELSSSKIGDLLIITTNVDSLDANNASEFREKVLALIVENSLNRVILDLHPVQFIDSAGLGSFLAIFRFLHSQGGELKLACLNKPLKILFELVSMHKVFELHNSIEEATRSFAKGSSP